MPQIRLLICLAIAISSFAQGQSPDARTAAEGSSGAAKERSEAPKRAPRRVKIPREALSAIAGFQLAPGIEASLFAAEPMVVNPVAITTDEQGAVYVCETFRQEQGVEDNREHSDWLEDDLASQSVADRLAMYRKHFPDKLKEEFGSHEDRVRMLVDLNHDGLADRASVYVNGFDDPLEGTGAGILVRKSNVYYTCIPRLWAFRDDDGDGKADRQVTLHDGFGARVAFRGHDLHGLCLGPDGRIYFSIGDRGYNVTTDDGRLKDVESGAIFRCEQDGSRLEVFATGFRNPQELAFDDWGNLFTGDNNSDSGDQARWVHVLQGMDAGWRMAFQYLPDRGPWNRERMWEPTWEGQPAYIFPPVANFADGPSGLAYYPGIGLGDAYQGNFFLCDFRGASAQSGVRTFKLRPRGATFELIDPEVFLWNCLATDVTFAPDGSMLVSDWVDGWQGVGKGRIYRLRDPRAMSSDVVKQLPELLKADVAKISVEQLLGLMGHPDQRVRREAQLELALRREVKSLAKLAQASKQQFARLHAIWGLGQIARREEAKVTEAARLAIVPFLVDVDAEVRVAAAQALGDCEYDPAGRQLTLNLLDSNPRVRVASAIALGKLGYRPAVPRLMEMLEDATPFDPAIRHAGIMGLVGCANPDQLAKASSHTSADVRLAAVVALRRMASVKLLDFLRDKDERVVTEAIRAIHDLPLSEGLAAVAEFTTGPYQSDAILRRGLSARQRLGGKEHADALLKFAASPERPVNLRQLALNLVANWEQPSSRDVVLGIWRPVGSKRDGAEAVEALRENLRGLLKSGHEVRFRATELAAQFGLVEAAEVLAELLWESPDATEGERAGAMLSLGAIDNDTRRGHVERALQDPAPRVRAAARMVLTRIDPFGAVEPLTTAIREGTQLERQSAIEMLVTADNPQADAVLKVAMEALVAGKVPSYLLADVVFAAGKRAEANPELKAILEKYVASLPTDDPLAPYRIALEGGNAERGGKLFMERLNLQCARCHRVGAQGGRVGPDLSEIAKERDRAYLLEAIVQPNTTIAKGFETLIVQTDEGQVISGIVLKDTTDELVLMTSTGESITVEKKRIEETSRGQSSMPADLVNLMTIFDLRDILEYLASLKGPTPPAP